MICTELANAILDGRPDDINRLAMTEPVADVRETVAAVEAVTGLKTGVFLRPGCDAYTIAVSVGMNLALVDLALREQEAASHD